jgi:predicted amidohydrolase
MSTVKLAATQMACSWDRTGNLKKAEALVREAADRGAQIILLQELFETPYFCQKQKQEFFGLATPLEENPAVARFREVARELEVVLPVSSFERANQAYFNTVARFLQSGRGSRLIDRTRRAEAAASWAAGGRWRHRTARGGPRHPRVPGIELPWGCIGVGT